MKHKSKEIQELPPLHMIYFYLCGDCNLACRHCWISPKFQRTGVSTLFLKPQLFYQITRQAKELGLHSIKLTGGEPLIHPDIKNILKFIRDEQISLRIETNGVFLTPEIVKLIRSCVFPRVSISIDGLTNTHDEIRGVKGSFEHACHGARLIANAKIPLEIIMTIMRVNQDEISDVTALASDLGASSIKFNFVQPTERGKQMHERDEIPTVPELIELGEWMETELCKETGIHITTSLPLAFRPLSTVFMDNSFSCGICGIFNILGVLSSGKYALCGIGESTPELVFGDANEVLLSEVWKNNSILQDIRTRMPRDMKGICADCAMKWRCLGSCVAQNFYSSGNLFSEYWFCRAAYQSGHFPESRRIPGRC